jgi:serine incorporator 1/3
MGMAFSCLGIGAASWITSTLASCFSAAACTLAFKSCNCNNSIATRVGFAVKNKFIISMHYNLT